MQRAWRETGQAPILSFRAKLVWWSPDGQSGEHLRLIAPCVAAIGIDADREVGNQSDLHACALGSILNDQTIPALHCKIVCGSANNQLADEKRHGAMIAQRGILYAPDFIVNAGGALSGIESIKPGGYNRQHVEEEIAHIYDTMEKLLVISREQQIPTYRAADLLAEQRIAQAAGKKFNLSR